jgi:hypothetical protein
MAWSKRFDEPIPRALTFWDLLDSHGRSNALELHTKRLQLANTSPCWNPNASIFLSRVLGAHLAFQVASLAPSFPAYSRRFWTERREFPFQSAG